MKKLITSCIISFACLLQVSGQQYLSRNTSIRFVSETSLEKIVSDNPRAVTVLNSTTGEVECSVLIKGFQFEKALMQQHFNESYLESDKYPKANFKGKLAEAPVYLDKPGKYQWTLQGELTMHGKTNPIQTIVKLEVSEASTKLSCSFDIILQDYAITIPSLVKNNIAKTVKVSVEITDLKKM